MIISSEFGFTHTYSDYLYPRPKLLSRGTIEYYFPSKSLHAIGIKIIGGIGSITSFGRHDNTDFIIPNFNTNFFFLGTGITYARKWGYSVPYLSTTISHLRINPTDQIGNLLPNNLNRKYDVNLSMYTAEFGIRFIVNNFWSVNLGMNINITNSDYLDDLKSGSSNDSFLSLFFGISLYHGGQKDSDNDGVEDNKDLCASTPPGLQVDSFGCPEDEDYDGVPDYLDKCPNTPPNVLISENGCPQDLDNDGIPDYIDRCPDSPIRIEVDSIGCPKISKEKLVITTPQIDSTKKIVPIDTEELYDFSNEKMLKDLFFTDGNKFCFQIGAFKSKISAEKVVKNLTKSGHNGFIVKAYPFNNEQIWYRVRIGYFNSLEEAKRYKSNLSNK